MGLKKKVSTLSAFGIGTESQDVGIVLEMEKLVTWEPALLVILATAGWGCYCSWAPGLRVAAISTTYLAQTLPAQMLPTRALELLVFIFILLIQAKAWIFGLCVRGTGYKITDTGARERA